MNNWLAKVVVGVGLYSMLAPVLVRAAAEEITHPEEGRRLLCAADNGDVVTVQNALRMKANPNIANGAGRTALMMAAEKGYEYIVAALIQDKADVNTKSDAQETPLWLAISQGRTNAAALLVDADADFNVEYEHVEKGKVVVRMHALLQAVEVGDPLLVRILLEKKANVNKPNGLGCHETPLMWAVKGGKGAKIIRELIRADADKNCTDIAGRTVQDYIGAEPQEEFFKRVEVNLDASSENNAAHTRRQRPSRERAPIIPVPAALEEIHVLARSGKYNPHKIGKKSKVSNRACVASERAARRKLVGAAEGEMDTPPDYEWAVGGEHGRAGSAEQKVRMAATAQEVYAMQHAAAEAARTAAEATRMFARSIAEHEMQGGVAGMMGNAQRVVVLECPLCTYHNHKLSQECGMCGIRLEV